MPSRVAISTATMVMLVVLRLTIGWHFFSEGVKHYTDPKWTSEPVLRAAKGPLAPLYRSYVPDFHGFDALMHGAGSENEEHAVTAWIDQVQKDWDGYRQQFAGHYGLNEAQQKSATRVLQDHQAKLRNWASLNREPLETHVHEWRRNEATRRSPGSDLPFQKQRLAEKQASLTGEASGWTAEIKSLERDYENALRRLLTADQRNGVELGRQNASIDTVDRAMTALTLGVGLLLLLGLFTRTASVVGALFLLSVVSMQPFWIADTVPTYNQYVELFALLTLATTEVGRWGGLDYFLSNLKRGSNSKG